MIPYYVVEIMREADKRTFMLCGHPNHDPDDTWYVAPTDSVCDDMWSRLTSILKFHEHTDHNKWICDFLVPELCHRQLANPVKEELYRVTEGNPHTLTIYLVDKKASLNLRFKPIVCKTFVLSGEPSKGAIKQGYYHEQ